tara:strand:+ start:1361 stop:1537 length:177 start_codon:yes stop_codon:yes gene_type:complete
MENVNDMNPISKCRYIADQLHDNRTIQNLLFRAITSLDNVDLEDLLKLINQKTKNNEK